MSTKKKRKAREFWILFRYWDGPHTRRNLIQEHLCYSRAEALEEVCGDDNYAIIKVREVLKRGRGK